MAETAYLASALVTGAVLLAVWAFVARMENWRRYELADGGDSRDGAEAGTGTGTALDERAIDRRETRDGTDSVGTWMAGFFALVLVAGGGAVLLVSDAALAGAVGSWVALALVFAALLLGFLLWGTYSSARFRGLDSAKAALLSAWLFGSLFVASVAVKLVLAG